MTLYSNKPKRDKNLNFGKNDWHQCIEYKILYRSVYTTTLWNKYLVRYETTKAQDIKTDKLLKQPNIFSLL